MRAREYASGGAGDGYIGQLNGFQSAWKIIRVDNDVETILATGPLSYANNDTFYFEANGSTLTLKKNGATLGSASSATYTSGEAGLGLYSTGGLLVDNWRGGGIVSGDAQPPSAPATLSATAAASNQINLAWSASSDNVGVTGYLVERCQGSGCSNFAQVANVTATSHNDASLTAATSYSYRVLARDAAGNLSTYSKMASAVTAASGNRAPVISGTPVTSVKVGQAYSFKPSVSDPDGDAVTLTIVNKPAWATFQGGVLSGTPTATGTWSGIEIWAADKASKTMLPAFSIAATNANAAPKISGTPPASVIAGQAYAFTPTASDPEGNTLYFQITNKPTWATFNTVNGGLSGTPSAAQVGTYSNISITVTDGTTPVALPSFAVTVAPAPVVKGTATLSWTTPTSNVDGSTLLDLAGYRIYYGTSAGSLGQVIDLPIAQATSYLVKDLSSGTFYFAVTAYTSSGAESAQSNVASKTIQ